MPSEDLTNTFREEACDLLRQLETFLLDLEKKPTNQNLIDQVFRIMHTLKGTSSMLGFDDVSAIVHEIETVFDLVRNKKINLTTNIVNKTLQAVDQIKLLLDLNQSNSTPNIPLIGQLINDFQNLAKSLTSASMSNTNITSKKQYELQDNQQPDNDSPPIKKWNIRFIPKSNFFHVNTNISNIFRELATLGKCEIQPDIKDVPSLETLIPENCYLAWNISLETSADLNAIRDIFIFIEDQADIKITQESETATEKKSNQVSIKQANQPPQTDDNTSLKILAKTTGTFAPTNNQDSFATIEPQNSQNIGKNLVSGQQQLQISAEKLNRLIELIGELVTVQARFSQIAVGRNDSELISLAEELERLSGDLRDSAMKIRMLPIGATFDALQKQIPEIARQNNKELHVVLQGVDAELDKDVIERLSVPLLNLVKLSIIHSIESAELRENRGKPSKATLMLIAKHFGGNFCIEVRDDGQGLDITTLQKRAQEIGLISPHENLTGQELLQLICQPNFFPDINLGIVTSVIDELRGSIEIENQPNKGLAFYLRLPLTLAIIEGLLVALGNWHFVLPLAAVEECIELTKQEETKTYNKNLVMVRDRIVPYIKLREKFSIEGQPPDIQQIVITSVGQYRVGFVVDQVIGEYQTVIKPLGAFYKNVKGISGATILGDGTVALIIDLAKIVQEETHLFDTLT